MKTTITRAHVLAAVLLGLLAGVAVTQPADSNWRGQDGIWHIGNDIDVESGGEIDIEGGGALRFQNCGSVTLAEGSTTAVVTGLSLPDTTYDVLFAPTANVSIMGTSSLTTSGFTISYQTATGSPSVRYYIVHQ